MQLIRGFVINIFFSTKLRTAYGNETSIKYNILVWISIVKKYKTIGLMKIPTEKFLLFEQVEDNEYFMLSIGLCCFTKDN